MYQVLIIVNKTDTTVDTKWFSKSEKCCAAYITQLLSLDICCFVTLTIQTTQVIVIWLTRNKIIHLEWSQLKCVWSSNPAFLINKQTNKKTWELSFMYMFFFSPSQFGHLPILMCQLAFPYHTATTHHGEWRHMHPVNYMKLANCIFLNCCSCCVTGQHNMFVDKRYLPSSACMSSETPTNG